MSDRPPKPLNLKFIDAPSDPNAEALAALEKRLQAQLDGRKEERFSWIVVVIALVDVIIFQESNSAIAVGLVGALQLILLVILARRLGVNDVVQLLDRLLHQVAKVEKDER